MNSTFYTFQLYLETLDVPGSCDTTTTTIITTPSVRTNQRENATSQVTSTVTIATTTTTNITTSSVRTNQRENNRTEERIISWLTVAMTIVILVIQVWLWFE